jgi:hypothetical protein
MFDRVKARVEIIKFFTEECNNNNNYKLITEKDFNFYNETTI